MVVEEAGDGLVGVALGVADQADRAALDPAGDVDRGLVAVVGGQHPARPVGDGAGGRVEGQLGQLVGVVADRPVDGLDVPVGDVAGAADVAGAVQLGALGAQPDHAAVLADDLLRGLEEVQEELVRAVADVADGPVLQGGGDHVGLLVAAPGGDRPLVVVDVLGVDDHLDGGRVVQLAQLHRAELGLRRAAPTEDVHLDGLVLRQAGVDVGRDVGGQQLVGGLGQDPGHVQGHVADPEHGDLLGLQRPGARHVRVAVVPGDEVGGAVGAVEFAAGYVQGPVGHRAGGEDHGVVEGVELVQGDVGRVVHVAEEPQLGLVEHLVQRGHDALDPRVVGRHAVADQSERCGHPLEQVDRHPRFLGGVGLHQRVSGVDAGGTGTDDGNTDGTRHTRRSSRQRGQDGA